MRVPLLDLTAQTRQLRSELNDAVSRVIDSGHFVLGEEVAALEDEIAGVVGARHGVGVSSGSDALLLALWALGVGPGDEVVTTPYSFFATVGSIVRLGARPVLSDIDPRTLNLDPEQAATRVSPRTKAVVPVHLFGRLAQVDRLVELCPEVAVVEDAAQALGARRGAQRAGSVGALGCLSFFPSKNLGAFGDAGMVLTSDDDLAARVRSLRTHGSTAGEKYCHELVGGNFRLDALQAAVLRAKLPHLPSFTAARQRHAARYRLLLADLPVTLPPTEAPGEECVYNQFVIRAPGRDQLQEFLRRRDIGTEVYYPRPLHLQPCFAQLGYQPGDFPAAEAAAAEALALPVYPELDAEQLDYVAQAISDYYGGGRAARRD